MCNWNTYVSPAPNPHILFGGLVGGPHQGDNYTDARSNPAGNEVAIDYNTGFQSTVAGLLQYRLLP